MKVKPFFLLMLLCILNINAQTSIYNFRNINISDGLSNNTVSSIAQDKFGQLWFGTSNGLNKFNGQEFTVYRNISRDKYSLSSSEISNVLVDKRGFVWTGTFNGLNKFNPKTKMFRRYYRRPSNKFSLSNSLITSSLEMPNGSIWFGTGNGVSIYDPKKDRFKRFLQGNFKRGIRSVFDIYRDDEHVIWLATSNGIVKVD
jgi:ligand-binding sensor domain-containing protein